MAALIPGSLPPPTRWSSCSQNDLVVGFSTYNLNSCLFNEPGVILGEPVCGNALREEGEVCDCGTPEVSLSIVRLSIGLPRTIII